MRLGPRQVERILEAAEPFLYEIDKQPQWTDKKLAEYCVLQAQLVAAAPTHDRKRAETAIAILEAAKPTR